MAKRKLTTIFCADAVQYSAMMAENEDATLQSLQDNRQIMRDHFSRYDGREINTWGDAVIAEFDSVVEAVRCAVEIQAAIKSRNEPLGHERRMAFRIGINLGDVIYQDNNVYGDGVNIASRLEALAGPGGIMVSKSVYDFAARQLAVGFDFAGEHETKPGEESIVGYSIRLSGNNQPEQASDEENTHQVGNDRQSNILDRALGWWEIQPKSVKVAVSLIGFFLAINTLFGGLADPWFIFPSFPMLLFVLLRKRRL